MSIREIQKNRQTLLLDYIARKLRYGEKCLSRNTKQKKCYYVEAFTLAQMLMERKKGIRAKRANCTKARLEAGVMPHSK